MLAHNFILNIRHGDICAEDIEVVMEGLTRDANCWALVKEVWKDYEYSKRLWKYFMIRSIEEDLWKEDYDLAWPNLNSQPHQDIKWTKHEDL